MDVTDDEAAIRTTVGVLAGDDEVEQFLAWLRLGVCHAECSPRCKARSAVIYRVKFLFGPNFDFCLLEPKMYLVRIIR